MSSNALDVVAVGDAIVEVIATCDHSFLETRGFDKGSMRLLSADEASDLNGAFGPAREISL